MGNNRLPKDRFEIASDVDERDGMGLEVYRDNELIVEIFRDDENKQRTVTAFKENVPLDLIEEAVEAFKKQIPWDFLD